MYINLEELKLDINNKGRTVTNIWNMRRRITKEPLLMFSVELKAVNNKDIYDINFLLQYKVKFEQPHVRRKVSQYSKCQRSYKMVIQKISLSSREISRVKCAGDHAIIKYPRKTRSENVKCISRNSNHSANQKECQELQRNMFPVLRKKTVNSPALS